MKLSCAVVGETGGAFEVDIDAGASVSALKEAIKFEKQSKLKDVDANKIQLFLSKKGKAWLSDDNVVLQSGDVSSYKTMRGSWKLNDSELFGSGVLPTEKLVHVLVVVPMEFSPRKKQRVGDVELMHFTTNEQAEVDAICKFGQGLTREDLFKGALLKVPHKVLRINLSGGLYVRQEYWDVHTILNEGLQPDDRVLVIGSPGIGKSVFGVFLLLLFMSERKNVAYRPFGIDAKTFFFTWNVIEKRYDGTL